MFGFARHIGGTAAAPLYRSDALAYRSGSGRVRGTVGPDQTRGKAEIFSLR